MDVVLNAVGSGFQQLMTPIYLAYLFGGVALGLVIGWLPGLGGISGMSIHSCLAWIPWAHWRPWLA